MVMKKVILIAILILSLIFGSAIGLVAQDSGCNALDLPFAEDFESYNAATYNNAGVVPDCWTVVWPASESYRPHVSTASYVNGKGLLMNANSTNESIAILPEFTGNLNNVIVKFNTRKNSANYGVLVFGYYLDSQFYPLLQLEVATTVREHAIDMSNESQVPDGARFAFQYTSNYEYVSVYYVNIDNVEIFRPASCGYVSEVVARNVTDVSATICWSSVGSANEWQVSANGDTYTVSSDTSFVVTGLSALTEYTVSVRASCGNDEYSDWKDVSFTTARTPAPMPYSCGFEEVDECEQWIFANGTQTNKWHVGSAASNGGSSGLYISNDNGVTNAYSIINTSYVYAYRTFNLMQAGDYSLSFDWKANGESTYDYMRVFLVPISVSLSAGSSSGISSSSTPSGWIAVDGGSKLNLQGEWQEYSTTLTVHNANTGFYNLVFYWRNDTDGGVNPPAAIDNISFVKISCLEVSDIVASNLTPTSATITWTARGVATEWEFVLSQSQFDASEMAVVVPQSVDDHSYQLDGLEENTTYYVYVRAKCSDEERSDWTMMQFTTPCNSINIDADNPYTENFDSYVGNATDYYAPTDYPEHTMPSCWTFVGMSPSTTTYPQIFLSSISGYAVSVNCMFFKSSSTTPAYAVLPLMSNDIEDLVLEFTYRNESVTDYNGILHVGLADDFSDIAGSYVEVKALSRVDTKTQTRIVFADETSVSGQKYIVFKYVGVNDNYYLSIDNVVVRNVSDNNAILSYLASTAQGDAFCTVDNDAHNISILLRSGYVAGSEITPNITLADRNATVMQQVNSEFVAIPETFSWYMTTADTTLTYKVIAENGEEQIYTAVLSVEACPAPSALASNQTSLNSVDLSWSAAEGTDLWNFYCSAVRLSPVELSALTTDDYTTLNTNSVSYAVSPETTYYWYVRADCGENYSEWLESSFVTWENCLPPMNISTELVGDDEIVVSWEVQPNLPSQVDDFERPTVGGGTFSYTNDGAYPWIITASPENNGTFCIMSSNAGIGSSQSSITMTYTATTEVRLSFNYWVMGESANYEWDYMQFTLDGVTTNYLGEGTTSWSTAVYQLGEGTHTMTWTYIKDESLNGAGDCAYIDKIMIDGSSSVVIYRNDAEVATLPATVTTYTDGGLLVGSYCYKIRTLCREGNESAFSDPVCQDVNDCYAVTNLSVGEISATSATISWTRGSVEEAWNISMNGGIPFSINELSEGVSVAGNVISYSLDGLSPTTTYTIAVQTDCGDQMGQSWPEVQFTTERLPLDLPYSCTFEDAGAVDDWVLENGVYVNSWHIGIAASHGGEKGLYISNNNGASNAYTNSQSSNVYAYCLLNFAEPGRYDVGFDWKSYGESNYNGADVLNAYIVPASEPIVAGNSPSASWILATNNSGGLEDATSWQRSETTVNISNAGNYKLVFFWKNDEYVGENPPAAVDNISVERTRFTILASAQGGGTISPSGEVSVIDGAEQAFAITPDEGHVLASLLVDGADQSSRVVDGVYTFYYVSTDHTILANFVAAHTITASAGEGGSITPDGQVVVADGASQSFSIVPDNGFLISSVLVDDEEHIGDVVNNIYTFTNVTGDHAIAVSFEVAPTYIITATASEGGSISPSGEVTVPHNGSQVFEIIPDEGHSLSRLVLDDTDVLVENSSYTVSNVVENHALHATFAVNHYNLTIHYVYADNTEAAPDYVTALDYNVEYSVASPEIMCYTASQTVVAGTMPANDVEVTVVYNANYYTLTVSYIMYDSNTDSFVEAAPAHVEHLTCDENYSVVSPEITGYTPTYPSVSGLMPAHDLDITIYYEVNSYTLTIHYIYAENGAEAAPDYTATLEYGAEYSVESPVIEGYSCMSIVLGVMPAEDVEETVRYYPDYYTIIATADEGGTITPEGEVVVHADMDKSFFIIPDAGYRIASVILDEDTENEEDVATCCISENGELRFLHVCSNHTIHAKFEPLSSNTFTIVATAGENGTITPSGEVAVREGTNQTFTITPDEGYWIASVTVDGRDVMSEIADFMFTFYNVTSNHTIDVTFTDGNTVDENNVVFMSIYPNPNNGKFSIDLGGMVGEALMQIVDARGVIVDMRCINVLENETIYYDCNLPAGAYIVRIIADDKVYVMQMVIGN